MSPADFWRWVSIAVPAAQEEEAAAALHAAGAIGVESPTLAPGETAPATIEMRAYFEKKSGPLVETIAARLAEAAPAARVSGSGEIVDARWVETWVSSLKPMAVGDRFVIEPVADLDAAAGGGARTGPGDRLRVRICPARAFGTGEHPTTRMCLEAMERLPMAGVSFLDAGTGSGVLAIAAALLGAARVVALDNDAEAVEVARRNASLNGVADRICFRCEEAAARPGERFDIMAANLTTETLEAVLPGLAPGLAPGGTLVLSGILNHQGEEVADLVRGLGITPVRVERRGGWCCVVGRGGASDA